MVVVETPHLILRPFTWDDLTDMAAIYADPQVMTFLGGAQTLTYAKQTFEWIFNTYKKYGFGLWAIIYKPNQQLIGRCGLVPQIVDEQPEIEIGYMLAREYWGKGLATEAAQASRDYGFNQLNADRLISLIDPGNIASQRVALKNGLTYEKDTVKWEKTVRVYAIHKNFSFF